MFGCQSDSYFAAQNKNYERFGGWEKENADYLLKAHNLILLVQNLSELAMGEAELKNTYLLAEEAHSLTKELDRKFKREAALKRVKLSSVLSEENDRYLQELHQVSGDNFDKMYYRFMLSKLYEIIEVSNDYVEHGHNERLIDFAKELEREIKPLRSRFQETVKS